MKRVFPSAYSGKDCSISVKKGDEEVGLIFYAYCEKTGNIRDICK